MVLSHIRPAVLATPAVATVFFRLEVEFVVNNEPRFEYDLLVCVRKIDEDTRPGQARLRLERNIFKRERTTSKIQGDN